MGEGKNSLLDMEGALNYINKTFHLNIELRPFYSRGAGYHGDTPEQRATVIYRLKRTVSHITWILRRFADSGNG